MFIRRMSVVTYHRIVSEYGFSYEEYFLWDMAPCGMVDKYQLFGYHAAGIFSTVILRWRWKQDVTPKYFNSLKSCTTPQNTERIIF